MNEKVLSALYAIGVLPEEKLSFHYDQVEDLSELWQRTIDLMPYKNIPDQWIKDKFGVEVEGDRTSQNQGQLNWSAEPFFD